MSEKLLKITYHNAPAGTGKKLNAYLRMPSNNFSILRREIDMYLFQERQLAKCEIRTYWIDSDGDEIEVFNQNDYEIFLAKCKENMHLQIAAVDDGKADAKQASAAKQAEDDPSNFVIHDGVECDACGALPLVGFRYKCIQCPNFDLCQACESAHKHADHLMVRMPTNSGPSVVEAWLSGPSATSHHHRRSSRRTRDQCPFAGATATATTTATSAQATPAGAAPCWTRRERRHGRRNGNVFSQFVDMMMHLPESNATPTAAAATQEAQEPEPKEKPTVVNNDKSEGTQKTEKVGESTDVPVKQKQAASTEANAEANAQEPVAAPRSPKEQAQTQATATPTPNSTPTTPVISLENLAQVVNPEYMRAGIEILNNFSEMFAKIIDPSAAADFGCAETSMASNGSTASEKSEASNGVQASAPTADAATATTATTTTTTTTATETETVGEPVAQTTNTLVEERRRSESLDQDWQMIDNTASPMANVSSSDALINLSNTNATTTDSPVTPARDFAQLGEMLRQHVNEEQQRELATAHTQTSQVSTVSTSTSTTAVATNSTSTSTAGNPPAPEQKRQVPIYHTDERINNAVHAMMAMGFSNEGAWLTQLLDSVKGNIPAALDIMNASQSGRN
ncbi:PREDICTED: protein ref(2)P [Drosophila arizonae]|uniref:Protein ref(2)P n=1 Tax=Drosophila arizonae TaxID=7263 RepID=A0ABM1NQX1_DROAR|nr:PREDICTED: protein ref(2)P [Drosophila arizonae]